MVEWIKWPAGKGRNPPCAGETSVIVATKGETHVTGKASEFDWSNRTHPADLILSYRAA